jgi:hypothetical protein
VQTKSYQAYVLAKGALANSCTDYARWKHFLRTVHGC